MAHKSLGFINYSMDYWLMGTKRISPLILTRKCKFRVNKYLD